MKELYIDEPAKWKTKILRQIPYSTAYPAGTGSKSCLYTLLELSVLARLSAHTDWIRCRYLFGANPSSSILRAHLCTTPSSMGPTVQPMDMEHSQHKVL